PGAIEREVLAWHFDTALTKLSDAEAGLASYDALKLRLQRLHASAESAGLSVSDRIDKALAEWDFKHAASIADDDEKALTAYTAAHDRVDAPRGLWKRFGMIGSNPNGSLEQAASDFNSGDYDRAVQHSNDAVSTVNGASGRAARRVLILAGVLGTFALAVL